MMEEQTKRNNIPQVGTGITGESHSSLTEGCPTDSGGGTLPFLARSATEEQKINPFERRSSLIRTPPKQRAMSSPNLEDVIFLQNKSPTQETKRKRIETPKTVVFEIKQKSMGNQDLEAKTLKIIELLGQQATALTKTVRESPNTKKEIREISGKIQRLTEQLLGFDIQELLRGALEHKKCNNTGTKIIEHTEPVNQISLTEASTQTEEIAMESLGTQTEDNSESVTKLTLSEIEECVRNDIGSDTFNHLVESEWEQDAFTRTTMKSGNLQGVLTEADLAVFFDPKTSEKSALIRRLGERASQIKEIVEGNKPEPERVVYIENSSRVLLEENEDITNSEQFTYLVGTDQGQDESEALCELYRAAKKLREVVKQRGKKQLSCVFQRKWDQKKCQKTLELALKCSEVRASLIFPAIKLEQSTNEGKKNIRHQQRIPTEAVIIQKGNKTYADLLKAVREEVHRRDLDENVNTAKMTKNGDLVLMIDKQKGNAAHIAEALKGINGDASVKTITGQRPNIVLHIKNLDAITTKEEIEESIKGYIERNNLKGDLRISSIRPTHGETQAATVFVTKEVADRLTQEGKIRIGLSNCRIYERIKMLSCYKCWAVGHKAQDCSGPDRSQLCSNCGDKNHQRKECSNNPYCLVCNRDGHKPLTMGCPLYRKEVIKAMKLAN